ncbi:hypothetical protein ACHAQA_008702 [Verticillium albo-atrum]
MLGPLRTLPLASLVWLFLQLAAFTAASEASGGYERMLLWTRYEAFGEIEGIDKQTDLLSQLVLHKWHKEKGTGPNGQFTYAEFMARIEGDHKDDRRFAKYKDLKAPFSDPGGRTPTIEECDKQLKAVLKDKIKSVNVEAIDDKLIKSAFAPPKTPKKPGNLYDKDDKYNSPYAYLIDRTEGYFQALRIKYKDDADKTVIINRYRDSGNEYLERSATLRFEASKMHLYKQLKDDRTTDPKNLGLNLKDNQIVTILDDEKVEDASGPKIRKSAVAGGPDWINVNIQRTMENAWKDKETKAALRERGFKGATGLKKWADNLGNPLDTIKQAFSDDNYNHFRIHKAMDDAWTKGRMTVGELMACPVKR